MGVKIRGMDSRSPTPAATTARDVGNTFIRGYTPAARPEAPPQPTSRPDRRDGHVLYDHNGVTVVLKADPGKVSDTDVIDTSGQEKKPAALMESNTQPEAAAVTAPAADTVIDAQSGADASIS